MKIRKLWKQMHADRKADQRDFKLIGLLNSKWAVDRDLGARFLAERDQTRDELLRNILARKSRRRQHWKLELGETLLIGALCIGALCIGPAALHLPASHEIEPQWILIWATTLFPLHLLMQVRGARAFSLERLTSFVEECSEKDLVGYMAEAWAAGNRDTGAVARLQLLHLLPQLRPEDAPLLTAEQRRCLHRALPGNDIKLTLGILNAFAQVGDHNDLPYVEALANNDVRIFKMRGLQHAFFVGLNSPDRQRVRVAAQECLPLLKSRLEAEQISQTLLRASSAVDTAQEQLLRPAADATDTPQEQLLRATGTPNIPPERRTPSTTGTTETPLMQQLRGNAPPE